MKYAIALMSVVILCLAMTQAALADNVNPPSWRGNDSTTSQIWEFGYDPGPMDQYGSNRYYEPDGPATNGLAPLAGTHAMVFPGDSWMATDTRHGTNRVGIWPMSGYVT